MAKLAHLQKLLLMIIAPVILKQIKQQQKIQGNYKQHRDKITRIKY